MKKTVLAGLSAALAFTALTAGVALAESPQPPAPRGGGMGPGGMGPMGYAAEAGEQGPLHNYMVAALEDALGISASDLTARQAAGETAYEIAVSLGLDAAEIPSLLRDARSAAWEVAAADGVITSAQLAWMKSRPSGMGLGNCDGSAQRLGLGMGGWRFQQQNP